MLHHCASSRIVKKIFNGCIRLISLLNCFIDFKQTGLTKLDRRPTFLANLDKKKCKINGSVVNKNYKTTVNLVSRSPTKSYCSAKYLIIWCSILLELYSNRKIEEETLWYFLPNEAFDSSKWNMHSIILDDDVYFLVLKMLLFLIYTVTRPPPCTIS